MNPRTMGVRKLKMCLSGCVFTSYGRTVKGAPTDKPIVFLSHSFHDADVLNPLKALLHKRASGSIDLFLSSDGKSLELGQNWVVGISDALAQAKLMFVFLSENSIDSRWVLFEAGNAYGKGIDVVPVCLPGLEMTHVAPPLSLLQGFNLHSHESLANLARKINRVCQREMDEEFSAEDFEAIFAMGEDTLEGLFGEWTPLIEQVNVTAPLNLLYTPDEVTRVGKMLQTFYEEHQMRIERAGSDAPVLDAVGARFEWSARDVSHENRLNASVVISPELFHLHAPLLDLWLASMPWEGQSKVWIRFKGNVFVDAERFAQTTKFYKTGVELHANDQYSFKHLLFTIKPGHGEHRRTVGPIFGLRHHAKLNDQAIRELIAIAFRRHVLMISSD